MDRIGIEVGLAWRRRAVRVGAAGVVLLLAACQGGSGAAVTDPADEAHTRAAAIARERTAEQAVLDQAALADMTRRVTALEQEVDTLKASRERVRDDVLDARLQALEVKAAMGGVAGPAGKAGVPKGGAPVSGGPGAVRPEAPPEVKVP